MVNSSVDESKLHITQNNYWLENKAVIKWDGKESQEVKVGLNVSYASMVLKESSDFNPKTRSLRWRVLLNERSVSLNQPRFKDRFESEAFEYVRESLSIKNLDQDPS